MQNIDVRFNASSNFRKVAGDLAALEAQAAGLANVFRQNVYAKSPALVDPGAWKNGSRAVHEASNTFRAAAASSGHFTAEQIRATSEAERYTKALQKQKLTLGEMRKHRGIMRQVYADQLRYQRMVTQSWGPDGTGRMVTDVIVPKGYQKSLDTTAQRTYMVGQMAKSAGTQIVNMGKNMQWAGRQLTVGFTYPVALFGAAAGMAAFKVDEAMTRVTKVYDVSAKAQKNEALRVKELNDLRVNSTKLAEEAARDYGMSINDTLNIEEQLAATGLAGSKLLTSTKETARISTLGDLDIQSSVDMTVALQNAFKDTIEDGKDLTEVFNYMNAVENATSLSLKDIAEATPRAAAGLAGLGVNAKEMTVMLVAMREKGVDAAQGANALKSATTRILNPVKKATDYYKDYGISLENISKESGGNLFEFLKMLAVEQKKIVGETEKETNRLRQKGIATLFGTYQFNRLNAALTGIGEAMAGTAKEGSQVVKAMELMGDSDEQMRELADAADRELGQKMEAVSGRFKAAWESMRIELAKMGMPFLEVATYAAELATNAFKFFNGMDEFKKKAALGVAAVMAIAGPIVMVGGLFLNLAGQFVTGTGRILSVLGKLGGARALVTKEEQLAIQTAQQQNKANSGVAASMATVAAEVNILTAAYEKATQAAMQYAGAQGVAAGRAGTGAAAGKPQTWAPATPQQAFLGTPMGMAAPLYTPPASGSSKAYTNASANAKRQATLARKALHTQTEMTRRTLAEYKIRQGIEKRVNGTNMGMTAMSASMFLMMGMSNDIANHIGKWLMIGTLAVPAALGLANAMTKVGSTIKANIALQKLSIVTSIKQGMAAASVAGTAATAWAATKGIGAGLYATLGPVGIMAAGLVGVASVMTLWKKRQDEIAERQRQMVKDQADLVRSTKQWADSIGKAADGYARFKDLQAPKRERKDIYTAQDFYSSEEMEGEMKEYGKMNPVEKSIFNTMKYMELVGDYGLSVAEAKSHMTGFFIAAGDSAMDAAYQTKALGEELGDLKNMDISPMLIEGIDNIIVQAKNASEQTEFINALGEQWGAAFVDAFIRSGPNDAAAMFSMLKIKILEPWENLRQEMLESGNFDPNEKMLQSAEALSDAWQSASESQRKAMFSFAEQQGSRYIDNDMFLDIAKNAAIYEKSMAAGVSKGRGLSDTIGTVSELMEHIAFESQTLNYQGAVHSAKELVSELLLASSIMDRLNVFGDPDEAVQYQGPFLPGDGPSELQALGAAMSSLDPTTLQEIETSLNYIADAQNILRGADAYETLENIINGVRIGSKKAKDEAKDLNKEITNIKDKTVQIRLEQVGDIAKDAMSAVQSDMADSAMRLFNETWDARMEQAQNAWENRADKLEAAHDRQQRRLDDSQERAQDAFDERWERRREAVDKAYERRKQVIEREIEAERRADAVRQRLFEREKNRLQRLADMLNTNIDFNTQLNEGKLDEAAKTLNNASVSGEMDQMDAEREAAEARSEARIKALEKKNERLEKERDKEVKKLEQLEKRMRRHLDRVQEARARALEKQQRAETKALEESEKAAMDSMDKRREYEEAVLDDRLELFKSYIARNQRDLERWMKEVGLSYDKFGSDVKAKGEKWSSYFRKSLNRHIRKAGMNVMSDNIWEKVGKKMGAKLLKGLGFNGLKDFRHFVRTGERLPGGGRRNNNDGGRKGGNSAAGALVGASVETRHEGGMVGSGQGSRGNIPNTFKGLHRTEKMVRAQKGEYVINKKSAKENFDVIDAINKGSDISGVMGGAGDFNDGFGGPVGPLAAVVSKMFMMGVQKAFNNNYQVGAQKERMAAGPSIFSGKTGTYGGRMFTPEQMKNAAIIASVGSSMGMSQRDLMIGIMTAIAESGLVNVNYGDRDSLGLFQQRPSMGWGTPAQVTNPRYAAAKFFGALKGHDERGSESPWMAAQHIQRSAFADGSNYQAWWAAAQAIFGQGLSRQASGGYVPGRGGKHRPIRGPVTSGLHGGNSYSNPPALDFAGAKGRPVYAIADGVIVQSRDIAGPLASDTYRGDGPYGSFGRMISMQTDGGVGALYAHLSRRSVRDGQRVKGGSVIGYSGNTGNSSGPHLHFGATNGPYAWLRRGGKIKYDNTPVIAHKGETMLSERLTKKFESAVGGGSETYNVTLDLRGAMIKEDVDIERAVNKAIDSRESKLGRKRVVN